LMPLSLTLAVVLYGLRVRFSVLLLIIGMLIPPLLLAFAHDLAIRRVRRKLLTVIIAPAPALTLWLAAHPLLATIHRRRKRTLAVRTTVSLVQADSSGSEGETPEENRNQATQARTIRKDPVAKSEAPAHRGSSDVEELLEFLSGGRLKAS
jgi:hypothetical protein